MLFIIFFFFEIASWLSIWHSGFSLFKDYLLTFIWASINICGTSVIIPGHEQNGEKFMLPCWTSFQVEQGDTTFLFQLLNCKQPLFLWSM